MDDDIFSKSHREQIIDLIDHIVINNEYRSALIGASNFLLNDIHIWRDNTMSDVSIFMADARCRLENIRPEFSDNDTKFICRSVKPVGL